MPLVEAKGYSEEEQTKRLDAIRMEELRVRGKELDVERYGRRT